MLRLACIMNPKSGVKKDVLKKEHLEKVLDPDKFEISFFKTTHRKHATVLAKQIVSEGFDVLLISGGDGTINECIQAAVGADIFIGILPTGSGNGLSRHTGIGLDFNKALQFINTMNWKYIDAVKLNNKYFINLAGIGFDGYLVKKIENRNYRGFWLYIWLFISNIYKYKAKNYTILMDNHTYQGDYILIVIANGPMYGYNFEVAPGADLTDGLLDVLVFQKVSLFKLIKDLPKIMLNKIDKLDWTFRFKTKNLSIDTPKKIHLHVDGEYRKIKKPHVEVEVIPNAIKLIIP